MKYTARFYLKLKRNGCFSFVIVEILRKILFSASFSNGIIWQFQFQFIWIFVYSLYCFSFYLVDIFFFFRWQITRFLHSSRCQAKSFQQIHWENYSTFLYFIDEKRKDWIKKGTKRFRKLLTEKNMSDINRPECIISGVTIRPEPKKSKSNNIKTYLFVQNC